MPIEKIRLHGFSMRDLSYLYGQIARESEMSTRRRERKLSWPHARMMLLNQELVPTERLPEQFPQSGLLDLTGIRISGTQIADLDLSFTDLSGTTIEDLSAERTILDYSKLTQSHVQKSLFRNCSLRHTIWDDSQLKQVEFRSPRFDFSRFQRVEAEHVFLLFDPSWTETSGFHGCNFQGARFIDSKFGDSRYFDPTVSYSVSYINIIDGADSLFQRAQFFHCILGHITLARSDFTNAVIANSTLTAVDMRGIIQNNFIFNGNYVSLCGDDQWEYENGSFERWDRLNREFMFTTT